MFLFKLNNQSVDDKLEREIGMYRKYCEDRKFRGGSAKKYVRKIQELLRNPDRKNPANLSGLDLIGIDLSDTNLKGCNFQRCTLEAVNFSNANLEDCNFEGSSLVNAQLDSIKINDGTNFDNSYLIGCSIPNQLFNILEAMQMQGGRLRLSF